MLPILFGVANAGLGIMQGIAGYQAQRQDYLNQRAYQEANNRFAMWQAGFNAKVQNANAQYGYWAETVNYNQQLAYAKSQRNVELLKSVKQAEIVRDTRAAAGAAFVQDSDALTQQFSEASMQEAVALQQYKWRALQARASVQAMAMEGNSVDRIVNDYARQEGDQVTIANINQGLRTRQYNREQTAQLSQYLARWQSQQFYDPTEINDPMPPFAPLPAMITPPSPSYTGGAPSGAAAAIGIGSSIIGGINAGISMGNQIKAMGQGGK